MWIRLQDKNDYNDSSCKGLKIFFDKRLPEQTRDEMKKFIGWLRKKYWFPIRLNLHIIYQKKFRAPEDGHYYYGVFYPKTYGKRKYPCICVASQPKDHAEIIEDYITISHEITHYYQWYFFDDENKSDLSLERTANRFAKQVVYEFIEENFKI